MAAHAQHTSGIHHGILEGAKGSVNITNSTLVSGNIITGDARKFLLEALSKAVAHTAFHDSAARYDPPKCHPNTRLAVLTKIKKWVLRSDSETMERFIMWLTGAAGAGKSAIMQSFIEQCLRDKIPMSIASFFFGRSDASRNHAGPLIATIAYQIYRHLPSCAQDKMLSIIDADPLIFTRNLDRQLSDLIVTPLQSVRLPYNSWPSDCYFLITIDGLDECLDKEAQQNILRVISTAIQEFKLPFLFLLASRPEHDINVAFGSRQMNGIYTRLYLDDTFHPDEDIRTFLEDSFDEIKTSHPFKSTIPSPWPAPKTTDTLVQKSSGQFIYAATVVRYVKSIRHKPHHRLETVMNLRPPQGDLPFAQLDALYTMILLSAEDIERVLYALSVYSHRIFEYSVDLSEFMSLEEGELEILFCDLGALVSIEEGGLKILHASLHDFLLDSTRSDKYFIGTDAYLEQHLINILGYLTADLSHKIMELRAASLLSFSKEHFATYQGQSEMLMTKASGFPLAAFFLRCPLLESCNKDCPRFIIYCWLPFLSRMGRLDKNWLSIQKEQEISLDQMLLSKMKSYSITDPFQSFICLLVHAGTHQFVPAWCQNNKLSITNFWGPLYNANRHHDPLHFKFIKINQDIAEPDNDCYHQCLTRFFKDPRRSENYVLGPDAYTKATLLFIEEFNTGAGLRNIQERLGTRQELSASGSIIKKKMWVFDVPGATRTPGSYRFRDLIDDTILALEYIAFFLSLSGWSEELFYHCKRQALPSKFMEYFPIYSNHVRQAMNEYVKRFKVKNILMRYKNSPLRTKDLQSPPVKLPKMHQGLFSSEIFKKKQHQVAK